MHFSRSFLLSLLSVPFLAFAQTSENGPNAFNNPTSFQATAGESLKLSWKPTTDGTVTLILRSGSSSHLDEGTTIASNIKNSGSYTWDVPKDAVRGSDYTIEIVDDSDPTQVNYTPYFVLESDNTVASVTSTVSLAAPTSSLSMSTAAPTATPSRFPTTTDSSSESDSGSMTTMTGSETSSTRSPTGTGDLQATTSNSEGAGARATAMAGMLGFVALGALAL